ncbi:hypothetical protein JKY79_03605 [Candidatus Babeliales bacterium]|nr:hypothetical protein [Candidatus Babeliales bacterium]
MLKRYKFIAMVFSLLIFDTNSMIAGRPEKGRGRNHGRNHGRMDKRSERGGRRGSRGKMQDMSETNSEDDKKFKGSKHFDKAKMKKIKRMIYDNFLENLEDPNLSEENRGLIQEWMERYEERKARHEEKRSASEDDSAAIS